MKVICVGEMLIDFTPGEEKGSYIANPGGAPANVAVSISRCGGKAGFLGRLGNDDFGRLLQDTLNRDGVEMLCPELTDEAVTTLAFVTLDERGNRSFTFARKPGADMLLSESDVDAVDFGQCSLVHAGSVSQSAAPEREAVLFALKKAKEQGKLVSFDVNYRDAIWSPEACADALADIFPLVDLLKISEEELDFVGGRENIPRFMEEHQIAVLVLTLGSEGAELFFDGQTIRLQSLKGQVVDTTGAGDAFWGAFLCKLLEMGVEQVKDITVDRLYEAGRYGICAGGLCVRKKGGIPALPYGEQIEQAMKEMERV